MYAAPVAQLDRASDYGSGGWGFESSRARLISSEKALLVRARFGGVARVSAGDEDIDMLAPICRRSSYFLPTLKQTPKDAELVSHRLLLRKTSAGSGGWGFESSRAHLISSEKVLLVRARFGGVARVSAG